MENIYLAKIAGENEYSISRVMLFNKMRGPNGEIVCFIEKSLDYMTNALGMVVFQPNSNSSFHSDNAYFFLDRKSARQWIEETLNKTTFNHIDIDSEVYSVDRDFNIAKHIVTQIAKRKTSDERTIVFSLDDCTESFAIGKHQIDNTHIIYNEFVLFSDIKDAICHTKSNLQQKIKTLNDEYLSKMADLTNKLSAVEAL